jgi:hypothetical protein
MRNGRAASPFDTGAEPDYRVIDTTRMVACVKHRLCWLCGERLGAHLAFVLGPMCTINRIISEPPSHRECAEFAMKACPFLARPRMRRNLKDLPEQHVEAAGIHSGVNPGVMALWLTRTYKPIRATLGNPGTLFNIGEPEVVTWWHEGRAATRDEVDKAMAIGVARLNEMAKQEGAAAVRDLNKKWSEAQPYLPKR